MKKAKQPARADTQWVRVVCKYFRSNALSTVNTSAIWILFIVYTSTFMRLSMAIPKQRKKRFFMN